MVSSVLHITSQVEHTKTQWYWQWKQVCKTNCLSSKSLNSVFLHVTLVLPYDKKMFLAWKEHSGLKCWLNKHLWLFQLIGGLQQIFCWFYKANEWVVLLSNRRKEYRRPKVWAKASYHGVLVERNTDDWFCYLLNHTIYFGCLAVELCMDKYIRKIITASAHHLKPVQGGTIRKQEI